MTVTQDELRYGTADLGLWVASVNGGFQIEVKRPGYGAWTAFQADSSTAAPCSAHPSPPGLSIRSGALSASSASSSLTLVAASWLGVR